MGRIPIDSALIFPLAGLVLVCRREQLLIYPGVKVDIPENSLSILSTP
jgi:hypothetical protein